MYLPLIKSGQVIQSAVNELKNIIVFRERERGGGREGGGGGEMFR